MINIQKLFKGFGKSTVNENKIDSQKLVLNPLVQNRLLASEAKERFENSIDNIVAEYLEKIYKHIRESDRREACISFLLDYKCSHLVTINIIKDLHLAGYRCFFTIKEEFSSKDLSRYATKHPEVTEGLLFEYSQYANRYENKIELMISW